VRPRVRVTGGVQLIELALLEEKHNVVVLRLDRPKLQWGRESEIMMKRMQAAAHEKSTRWVWRVPNRVRVT